MRPGQHKRLPDALVGALVVLVVAFGSYVAFFKNNLPWAGGYRVQAVFSSSQGLPVSAQVRIAGVTVGKVTGVELLSPSEQAAYASTEAPSTDPDRLAPLSIATMELDQQALPLKEDATFALRPRLFLEGNLFVDVRPGSPAAPEAPEDYVFGVGQTSTSVKLDRVLTTLQGDVRSNLQTVLREFGDALVRYHGAEGLNEFYATAPGAFRYTSEVSQALLGTDPHDLSRLVSNFGRVSRALDANETQLQDLVTNLRIVAGALAANSPALQRSVAELPRTLAAADPAFTQLNAAFPPLRALAREALPGVRAAPEALAEATPLMRQLRLLASEREGRGLIADLEPAVPDLARLSGRTSVFLEQARALSSCANEVVIPWANDSVSASGGYPFPAVGPVYKETGYALVGAAGESRSGDANGQYVRAFAGGGANGVVFPPTAQRPFQSVGVVPQPILGSTPAISSSAKTPYRPEVPCETQEPPNLDAGGAGAAPSQVPLSAGAPAELDGPIGEAMRRIAADFNPLGRAADLYRQGEVAAARRIRSGVVDRILALRDGAMGGLVDRIRALGGEG